MAVTKITYTQAGSTTQYAVPFEVIAAADIDVYIEGVLQLQQNTTSTADATHPQVISGEISQGTALTNYTVASNNATITFNAAPTVGNFILLERTTDDTLLETFVSGSTVRAQDLNSAFERVLFIAQEGVGIADDALGPAEDEDNAYDALGSRISNVGDATDDDDAVNRGQLGAVITDDLIAGEGIDLTDVAGGSNSGQQVTISAEFSTDSNPGIITVDATTPITRTYGANGQLDLSIADGAIDIAKIDPNDIITLAEQNAGPSVNDTSLFTSSAAAKRFDTIVQVATPTDTDYPVGKTWLQNDDDLTLSVWNGSGWTAITSGGTFTSLSKVVYVDAVNGDDNSEGHRISNPKQTIRAAVEQINAETDAVGNGSVVIVAPGIYAETFPINIEKNDVSIVGTSLRNCIVHPAIPAADQAGYDVDVPEANELSVMFRVNSGTYIQNLTLQGMKATGIRGGNALDTDATYGLPTSQGWNFAFLPGAIIRKSPYIQNCTNFSDSQTNNVNFTPHVPGEGAAGDLDSAPTGGGALVDGSVPDSNSPLRSMVFDSYTHTALDGPGIFVTNNGYVQATSSYAFFNHYHLKCLNGGQANLAASTTDFGRYSLIADGRSTTNIFTATLSVSAGDGDTTFTIGTPTADASWHGAATRPQPNMLVQLNGITYPILSSVANGAGWDVTISRPDPLNRSNNLGLNGAVTAPATAQFFLRSMIASSGHTMEYVGSGTNYNALPENGGVPVEANQRVELNDGAIWTAITDHNGKFTVGDFFEIDQQLGFVTIPNGSIAFDLASDSTPELAANLDANSNRITDLADPVANQDASTKKYVDDTFVQLAGSTLTGELDMNTNKIVNVGDPTAAQDAATKNYVDTELAGLSPNSISQLNSNVTVTDTGTNGTITFTTDGNTALTIESDKDAAFRGRAFVYSNSNTGTVSGQAYLALNYNTTDKGFITSYDSAGNLDKLTIDGEDIVFRTGSFATNFTFNSSGALGLGSTPTYGTAGQVLTTNGSGSALTWADAAGGGATGGGSDQWAVEHDNTITTSYTISTGKNVISAGPMTINSGAVVTVPTGSNWVIV